MAMSEPMTPARLAEIAARAEAASKGPWEALELDGNCYLMDATNGSLLTVDDDEIACVSTEEDLWFIAHARTDIPALLAEVARLEAENARLQSWITDLQSCMYVNCVYCGHRYGPNETTPVSMADALKAHVEVCPKHPMSALKKRVAELESKQGECT